MRKTVVHIVLLFHLSVILLAQPIDTSQINLWNIEAKNLLNQNKFDDAIKLINKAEEASITIDWPNGLLQIYATKSSIQNVYNKHYEALSTGLKGLELAKKQKDLYYEVLFYRSLANNYDMLDNYEKAVPYYEKCISTSANISKAEKTRGHCFVEYGDAYRLHFKKPAEARKLIEKGIEIYQRVDSSALGYAYDYLGQALTDLGLYKEAEGSFILAKSKMKKYGDEYLMPELAFHTANLYLAQKDYKKAISEAQEGLVLSKKMQTIYGESEANRSLYEAYKATGKTALALEHFEKYTRLRDLLTKANIDSRFEQIQNEAELQKKEAQLTELQQKTEQRNLLYLLGGISSLLLVSIFFIRYFLKQTALLKAKNSKISEALVVGQAAGKQQLSMQIRDSLGSSISAINWTLDLLSTNKKSQEEQKMMESLKSQLMKSYEKVNLLSKNVLPEDIENQGLKRALVSLLESTNQANGTNYQLRLPEDFNGTEPKIEFEIYNIVQDLMLLDQKYGNLHKALFFLKLKDRKVSLIFTSNNMNMELIEDILMRNIEFRVESLSGKLSLEQINRDSLKFIAEFKINY